MNAHNARKYAAKWFADDNEGEPTDEALRQAFAYCVRPAKDVEYPAIRAAIESYTSLPPVKVTVEEVEAAEDDVRDRPRLRALLAGPTVFDVGR